MAHLKRVPDPRVKRTQRHELMDLLVIALCAVVGGADDWVGERRSVNSGLDTRHALNWLNRESVFAPY